MSSAKDGGGFAYEGQELKLFSVAHNWRSYWGHFVSPLLRGNVLEVGAGIGTVTQCFSNENNQWTSLEPDEEQLRLFSERGLPPRTELCSGTILDLGKGPRWDQVLYIDVLEHIENDTQEIAQVASLVRPGGYLIILVPAHNWLFSPFDRAVGHFRRYSRRSLAKAIPSSFKLQSLRSLDSAGLLASVANRVFLGQSMPSARQIRIWDRLLIPISRIMDPLFGFRVGKSLLGIWRKQT